MAAMNKRKRESREVNSGRTAPGPSQVSTDFDDSYLQTGEGAAAGNTDPNMDFAAAFGQHGTDSAHAQGPNATHVLPGGEGGSAASDTAAAAMAQYHTMTVPQSTESAFLAGASDYDNMKGNSAPESGSASGQKASGGLSEFDISGVQSSPNGDTSPTAGAASGSNPLNTTKPVVGSDEWHKVRKDNHKEVERRRREAINEGISELANIVPGCEKNKGSILTRAVQFITQLKENESQNIEKWTLEKLLTEQAIAELSSSCDKLKAECQRAWTECERWKTAAKKAGVTIEEGEDGKGDDDA